MFELKNFLSNDDITTLDNKGPFRIIEYKRDLSISPHNAQLAYFCEQMNVKKRQVVCNLSTSPVTVQSGAMQWTVGKVEATTGIKGVGDMLGKAFRGKATGEAAIKPEYTGNGFLILEPTYKHLFILDVAEWPGGIVLGDGMFFACESKLNQKTVARQTLSSATLGNEGLFNLCLSGEGLAVLESYVPYEELIEVRLENDEIKLDGSFAIAWSNSLQFTVERSGKTLLGSAASGDGLVNVYRGTGKLLIAPVM